MRSPTVTLFGQSTSQAALLEAEFVASVPDFRKLPFLDQPEIALLGRSNVGKSSILNALTGSNKLARTSRTPGCTKLFNLYSVRHGGYLVDLPGYGYAKTSRSIRKEWSADFESYLRGRRNLIGVLLVVDCRRQLQDTEKHFLQLCADYRLKVLVLVNKIDKLSYSLLRQSLNRIRASVFPTTDIQPLSARNRGEELKKTVETLRQWLKGNHSMGLNPVVADTDIDHQRKP